MTIHPTAIVSEEASIGPGCRIGPHAVIHAGVQLGAGSHVGPHCVLGEPVRSYYDDPEGHVRRPLIIGDGAILRTGTVIYEGAELGVAFQTGVYAVVREGTRLGEHCSLGSYGDLEGDCVIGSYCRFHSGSHVGQRSVIGDYVWLMPDVIVMNDYHPPVYAPGPGVTIGDFSVIGARTVLLPCVVGKHVIVAAQAQVRGDLPDFSLAAGNPAKRVGDCRHLVVRRPDGSHFRPYPWPDHRNAGYPFDEATMKALRLQ
jgi:acyl-[acyl carrier protein]--UDP-N-acetylglucosamine O-acyltransferase